MCLGFELGLGLVFGFWLVFGFELILAGVLLGFRSGAAGVACVFAVRGFCVFKVRGSWPIEGSWQTARSLVLSFSGVRSLAFRFMSVFRVLFVFGFDRYASSWGFGSDRFVRFLGFSSGSDMSVRSWDFWRFWGFAFKSWLAPGHDGWEKYGQGLGA